MRSVGLRSSITRKSAASEMFAVGNGSRTRSSSTSSSSVFPDPLLRAMRSPDSGVHANASNTCVCATHKRHRVGLCIVEHDEAADERYERRRAERRSRTALRSIRSICLQRSSTRSSRRCSASIRSPSCNASSARWARLMASRSSHVTENGVIAASGLAVQVRGGRCLFGLASRVMCVCERGAMRVEVPPGAVADGALSEEGGNEGNEDVARAAHR